MVHGFVENRYCHIRAEVESLVYIYVVEMEDWRIGIEGHRLVGIECSSSAAIPSKDCISASQQSSYIIKVLCGCIIMLHHDR
jgi:hypothetical protein